MTPLHVAAARGRVKIIEYLVVEQGADVNIQDLKGVSVCDCTMMLYRFIAMAIDDYQRLLSSYVNAGIKGASVSS